MIQVVADLRPGVFRLDIDGHEEHAADGLVCAAVTAIAQTALLGIAEIARQHPDIVSVEITEE